jgi:hypothetical protein
VRTLTVNGQLQTAAAIRQHKTKKKKQQKKQQQKRREMDQLRLFTLRHELLNISLCLDTEFVEVTHIADEQWLKDQLNVKLLRVPRRNIHADCFEVIGTEFDEHHSCTQSIPVCRNKQSLGELAARYTLRSSAN